MKAKKLLVLLLSCLMVAGALVGCGAPAATQAPTNAPTEAPKASDAGATDDSLNKIKTAGKLIMGLDDSFPPMGFRDEKNELVGFDVDMAKAVAEKLGVELVLQPIDWTAKEVELDAGNIDVIWNGYSISDERKEKVLFSEAYLENQQILMVRADSGITKKEDLKGKKVAVQNGSTAQEALQKDDAFYKSLGETLDFKDNVTALLDLETGSVDAVAIDSVVGNYYMTIKEGKFSMLEEQLAPEEYGIGFRKSDVALRDAVQAALDEMKEDGTSAEISKKWFGKDLVK